MIGGGFGAPGQREAIKSGPEQDLHTPLYQTLALMLGGSWVLFCLVCIALVIGSWLAVLISIAGFYIRWRRFIRSLRWILVNTAIHVLVVVWLDGIWTTYCMAWTPWIKLIWTILWLLLAAPVPWFYVTITIRVADPNYPSPRKAVEQRQPQMPWYRDQPVAVPTELIPRLVRTQVESKDPAYRAGMLDLPPVREWYAFALWVLRNPGDFTEDKAKSFQVKLDLKRDKPPWYGRGFRQVRADILARLWGRWVDEANHEQGFILFPEALASFRVFCEDGLPTPPAG